MIAAHDLDLERSIADLQVKARQLLLARDFDAARPVFKELQKAVNSRSAVQVAHLEMERGLRPQSALSAEVR